MAKGQGRPKEVRMSSNDPVVTTAKSGLAIYAAAHCGPLKNPVLLLLDEDEDFTFVDLFVSEWDIEDAYNASAGAVGWPDKVYPERKSFKPEIDAGELIRIGPMPRRLGFYRRS
jgi:hypothetical protein